MKIYFKSEIKWKGFKEEELYYIKYTNVSYVTGEVRVHEFWTDDLDEFKKKLSFVELHIGSYRLLDKREPVC